MGVTARSIISVGLWVAGCGQAPARVRIVDEVFPDGTYGTRDARIETLTDLRAVRGDAAEVFGNARFVIEAALNADRGGSRAAVVHGAGEVTARWIMAGDVAVPADFDSLVMLTAYFHFERASQLFTDLGVARARDRVPVYYQPLIDDPDEVFPTNDNAFYWPEIDGFVLLPNIRLQQVPFAVNPGVLTHECAHRVWYYEAWGGEMFALLARLGASQATWNLIRSADEGVADFFAALLTGDPRFLGPSIDPDLVTPRDLEALNEVQPEWLAGDRPFVEGGYDPYALGSVTGSSLWAFGGISGREVVAGAILDAARQLASRWQTQLGYAVGDLEAEVIGWLPSSDREALCTRAALAYAVAWEPFTAACP